MRGDFLARQRGIIGAIKVSPTGLTVAEIGQREETATRPNCRALEALQLDCRAKAQSTPRETFRVLSAFFDIFLLPSHFFRKTIKKFSTKSALRFSRLGVRGRS